MQTQFAVGNRVHWDDPAEGASSGEYTIVRINVDDDEAIDSDTIILITNDAGSEAEVFASELELIRENMVKHDTAAPIAPPRPLTIGEKVSHREDAAPFAFEGYVELLPDENAPTYVVRWADGMSGCYSRGDLIAQDDDDACQCKELPPEERATGHHPDCPKWDSHASAEDGETKTFIVTFTARVCAAVEATDAKAAIERIRWNEGTDFVHEIDEEPSIMTLPHYSFTENDTVFEVREESEDERDHRETAPDGDARSYDPESGAKLE